MPVGLNRIVRLVRLSKFVFLVALTCSITTLSSVADASMLDFFSDKAADLVKAVLKKQGVELTWKQFDSTKKQGSGKGSGWKFVASDVCIKVGKTVEKACFESVEAGVRYKLGLGLPTLQEIGPITMKGGVVVIASSGEKTKKPKVQDKLPMPPLRLPDILQKTAFKPLSIDIVNLTIKQPGGKKITGEVAVKTKASAVGIGAGKIIAKFTGLPQELTATVDATLASKSGLTKEDFDLNLDLKAQSSKAVGGEAKISATPSANGLRVGANLSGFQQERKAAFKVNAVISEESVTADITGQLQAGKQLPNINLSDCQIRLGVDLMNLGCKAITSGLHVDKVSDAVSFEDLGATVTANVRHRGLIPNPSLKWSGIVKFATLPWQQAGIDAGINVNTNFSGVPARWRSLKIQSQIDTNVDVQSFATVVDKLHTTSLAVPAPLNDLDGTVKLVSNGRLDSSTNLLSLPLQLTVDLESTEQKIAIDSSGKLEAVLADMQPSAVNVQTALNIDAIRLRLPNLQPTSMPQLVLDQRIQATKLPPPPAKEPDKEIEISYVFEITSASANAIELITEHTKRPIPIAVNAKVYSDKAPQGKVAVGATELKLFRRQAQLDHFDLLLDRPTAASKLDGSLSVKYVDYKVLIRIAGTAERPRVILESEPPLPEEDIIAVLIYGEPMSSLDASDSSSVGEMSAAMTNRALALASLYLFASTPIQRIGYDPNNNKVSARVRLGEGTSLVLGGNEEQQEAGVRRSLGKGWYITTLVHTPDETSDTTVSTFLEWLKRF